MFVIHQLQHLDHFLGRTSVMIGWATGAAITEVIWAINRQKAKKDK